MSEKTKKNFVGKAYLVDALASKLDISKTEAERIFNVSIEIQQEALLDPSIHGIQLIGFYTIEKKDIKAKMCSHPKTGEKYMSPASKSLKLKIGKNFKGELNK